VLVAALNQGGDADGAKWSLVIIGLGTMGVGAFLVSGARSDRATVLIVVGAGLVTVGALFSWLRQELGEVSIGLKGIRLRGREQGDGTPWVDASPEALSEVSRLMLGDGELAQETVKAVLVRIEEYQGRVATQKQDRAIFRTLVGFLERADEQRWRDGRTPEIADPLLAELCKIPFGERIAYGLRQHGLPVKEVGKILDRKPGEIEQERLAVREAIAPHIGEGWGQQ